MTAKQIETGADVEIMNPDLVICTLDRGAHLSMEMTVETGRGYIPAAALRKEDTPIGLVADRCAVQPRAQGRVQGRTQPRRPSHRL